MPTLTAPTAAPNDTPTLTPDSRARGALWGQFIGDALAMPVHWYYDTAALRRDYGTVTGYVAPKQPHTGQHFLAFSLRRGERPRRDPP